MSNLGALQPQFVTVTIPDPVINVITLPDSELAYVAGDAGLIFSIASNSMYLPLLMEDI